MAQVNTERMFMPSLKMRCSCWRLNWNQSGIYIVVVKRKISHLLSLKTAPWTEAMPSRTWPMQLPVLAISAFVEFLHDQSRNIQSTFSTDMETQIAANRPSICTQLHQTEAIWMRERLVGWGSARVEHWLRVPLHSLRLSLRHQFRYSVWSVPSSTMTMIQGNFILLND